MNVQQIAIAAIAVGDRLRDLNMVKLERIRISMKERGQLTPIDVQATPGAEKPYRLVFGLHRLKAAGLVGLDTIAANIVPADADVHEVLSREIDENLARYDLSQYDRANFIARRAEIWELKKGKIKQGPKKLAQVELNSFNVKTAAEFGISDADVRRHRTRLKKIDAGVWARLRGTEVADNGSQLDKIKKLTPKEQQRLVDLLTGPVPVRFKDAYDQVRPSGTAKAPPTAQEEADALWKAYRKASKKAQKLLLAKFQEEIEKHKSPAVAA